MEWLIKSYSDAGDTVMDNCMGSGTTGVACVNTDRNFIGIEMDEGYYSIANKRIDEALGTIKPSVPSENTQQGEDTKVSLW